MSISRNSHKNQGPKVKRMIIDGANSFKMLEGECRICQEVEKVDQLMSPCICDGSIRYIHYNCLVKCIESKSSSFCEICHGKYRGVEIKTYKRSFQEFLNENHDLRNEFIFAVVLMVLMKVSLIYQYITVSEFFQGSSFWLHAFIQSGFTVFYLTYMYYAYNQWVPANLRVKVIKKNLK